MKSHMYYGISSLALIIISLTILCIKQHFLVWHFLLGTIYWFKSLHILERFTCRA